MTFDLAAILESKRVFRQRLAARPIVEKLALLDELHARALALRSAREGAHGSTILREESAAYRPGRR